MTDVRLHAEEANLFFDVVASMGNAKEDEGPINDGRGKYELKVYSSE